MPPSVPCPEQPGESSGHGASSGGHRQRGEEGVEEDQENQGCSGDEQGDIQHDLIIMTARRRRQSGIGPGGPSYSRLRGPDSGHALQVFVSTVLVAAAEPQEVQFPEDVVVDEITVDEWVLAATILVVAVVLAALVRRLAVQALSRRDASEGAALLAGRFLSYVVVLAGVVYAFLRRGRPGAAQVSNGRGPAPCPGGALGVESSEPHPSRRAAADRTATAPAAGPGGPGRACGSAARCSSGSSNATFVIELDFGASRASPALGTARFRNEHCTPASSRACATGSGAADGTEPLA
jgi:hypothetical protein